MGGAWAWFRLSVVVGVALTISSVRAFVCYATQSSPCLCESDDISERVDLTYYDDNRCIMPRRVYSHRQNNTRRKDVGADEVYGIERGELDRCCIDFLKFFGITA